MGFTGLKGFLRLVGLQVLPLGFRRLGFRVSGLELGFRVWGA